MCLHVAGIFAYHMFGGRKNFSFYFQADAQMTHTHTKKAKDNNKR